MNIKTLSALASAAVLSAAASAQGGISVIVDGNPVHFTGVGPQEVNGRVLVPLRGVLEQLGAYVNWDPAGQLVTAERADTTINLRIGDRVAKINDQPVTMDVPAEIYNGTTLVPLRFVSESLGADVRWEPDRYAVVINTGSTVGARAQEYNNLPVRTTTVPLTIERMTFDRSGWISAGTPVTVTVTGTPGAVATLTIPGVSNDIPMEEVSPGVYQANWIVPDDLGRINLAKAAPRARLRLNDVERVYTYSAPATPEAGAPPVVTSMFPVDGSTVTVRRPTISTSFSDTVGSQIDPQSIRMTIDDRDVTPDATITSNYITYTPDTGFGPGRHVVRVTASDIDGNQVSKTWSFRVANGQQAVQSFTVEGAANARPGDVIRVNLVGPPGGTATFSIGSFVIDRPMEEITPGRYSASYTVRRGETLNDQPIYATFVGPNGVRYSVNSTDRVDLNAPLDMPTITMPRLDVPVSNPLVVEGTAPAGARVSIEVDYATTQPDGARLTGAVTNVVAVADENGHFATNPIDLTTFIQGRGTTYTITATTLGPRGLKSEPASITVSH